MGIKFLLMTVPNVFVFFFFGFWLLCVSRPAAVWEELPVAMDELFAAGSEAGQPLYPRREDHH